MPVKTDSRESRRKTIQRLIRRRRISSQDELAEALANAGFEVGQSSISRDLKDLGVIKVDGRYTLPAAASASDDAERRLTQFGHLLRGTDAAGPHLTVVRTAIGAAPGVGLAIDAAEWPEVVGTIAGDDTVFVATNSVNTQRILMKRIAGLIRTAS